MRNIHTNCIDSERIYQNKFFYYKDILLLFLEWSKSINIQLLVAQEYLANE